MVMKKLSSFPVVILTDFSYFGSGSNSFSGSTPFIVEIKKLSFWEGKC